MTKEEASRIDQLYREIIGWRREDSDRLLRLEREIISAIQEAVDEHRLDCAQSRLVPMSQKVDWLYENAKKQCAEVQLRRRWQKLTFTMLGALCTIIGVATPYLLRLI